MLNMFKALETSGLRGFLGCESVVYEKELEQFFDTALVQDGDIKVAISGKYFYVSQSQFADVFELPTEGLVSFSDVPKHLVYKARSIFSQSGEQVSIHGKKRFMKHEYRLLNDILAKAIIVKAGSFDAVTNERFMMMTAIHFGLKVNWSKVLFSVLKDMVDRTQKKAKGYAAQIGVLLKSIPAITMGEGVPFPISKILSIKTVNTYVAMNHTIDARSQSDEPGVADVAVVKRKSKSKKKYETTDDTQVEIISVVAGLKKRPAAEDSAPVIPKMRRTVKGKASLDVVPDAQDVVPMQIIEPISAATVVKSLAPKRISREHCDVLSMQIDSDLVIYRTTLVRTFQVIIIFSFGNLFDRSDLIGDQSCNDVVVMDIVIWTRARWAGLSTLLVYLYNRLRASLTLKKTHNLTLAPNLSAPLLSQSRRRRRPPPSPPPPPLSDRTCSDQLFEEFPSVLISSGLLVQADEGTLLLVADLIRRNLPPPTVKCRFSRETGRSQVPRRQQDGIRIRHGFPTPTGSDDEIMDTQEPVKENDEIAEKHTDEIADIIGQITVETLKMWSDNKEQEEQRTGNVVEAENSKVPVVEKEMDKAVSSKHTEEEHMSIDDLLLQISDDMMLPSVTAAEITKIRLGDSITINEVQERDWYYASLPRISTHDKGKEPLEENEPVRGNPAKETVELICGDVDFLVQLRDKRRMYILAKYREMLLRKFLDSHRRYFAPGQPWMAMASQIIALLSKYREMLLRKFLDSHRRYFAPGQPWMAMASQIIALLSVAHSKSLEDILAQRQVPESVVDTEFVPHGLFIEPVQYWGAAPSLIKTWGWARSARQDGQNQDDIQTLRFNAFQKVVLAQGVTAGADSVEVRKEIKALDAKITSLDGQVAAIRNEQLEFQSKIAADILNISTQLGDLVDYIRGGDAKKGEGSSRRCPLPPPVNQSEGSGGDTVRTTEITQRDIDNTQRKILERLMAADRQRERERELPETVTSSSDFATFCTSPNLLCAWSLNCSCIKLVDQLGVPCNL
ncbi:hypothetical protein F511_27769 [Dorcoceras hygrometricum]|uniref:Dystroglycan-like n=1 Tax=Dorcoceras hygrometricum TaxID=472368 RepID=A0A2Z7AIE8_9LAMI|nr:hypothetical protein F511_27769 [Dorcoceras hygrometricum]